MKRSYTAGQTFGGWTLEQCIGGGGNGEVWRCKNAKGDINAIKLLRFIKPKTYSRFKDEVSISELNSDILGIMPTLEKFLPEEVDKAVPYYVMQFHFNL